jgi:hypothetical protein
VRQGAKLTDAKVAHQVERILEQQAAEHWHDDSTRHALAQLCELLLCGFEPTLLHNPPLYYLMQWRRFAHVNEIIRCLTANRSEASWSLLMMIRREGHADDAERLEDAAIALLRPTHFDEFLALVSEGAMFGPGCNEWQIERLAPTIVEGMGGPGPWIQRLAHACQALKSSSADALAAAVASAVGGGVERTLRATLLLTALDAGRANDPHAPVYRALADSFWERKPLDGSGSMYETLPKSCNELRQHLYCRAKSGGPGATACRRLLAEIEANRRERGRPNDEPHHPMIADGLEWTAALLSIRGSGKLVTSS